MSVPMQKHYVDGIDKDVAVYLAAEVDARIAELEKALREVSNVVDSAADGLMLLSEIEAIQDRRSKRLPQDVVDDVSKVSVRVIEIVQRVL